MLTIWRICNIIHKNESLAERGTPFWGEHAAKNMLIKDVADGIGRTMMPRQLWESKVDYQAFLYDSFVNVFMKLGKRDLLGHIGSSKGTNTEGNYTVWRQIK